MINLNCQSCGMPMDKPEDHGGGDANNPFCQYCTDAQGNLLPKDQVRNKMIQFYVQKQGKTQEEAQKLTDQLMSNMPAWKGGAAGSVTGTPKATTPPTTEPVSTPAPEPVSKVSPEPSSPAQPTETPSTSQPTEEPSSSPPASSEPVTGEKSQEPTAE